jgi:hypothetical protein
MCEISLAIGNNLGTNVAGISGAIVFDLQWKVYDRVIIQTPIQRQVRNQDV